MTLFLFFSANVLEIRKRGKGEFTNPPGPGLANLFRYPGWSDMPLFWDLTYFKHF